MALEPACIRIVEEESMPARLLVPIAISSVAAALAVAGAFAHVEPQSGPSPRKGGTLRVALGFSIPAIDPSLDLHSL